MLYNSPGVARTEGSEAQLSFTQFGIHACNIASYTADAHRILDWRNCMTECHFLQAEFLSRDSLLKVLFAQAFQIQLFFCHCIEFDSVTAGAAHRILVIVYL